MISRLKWVIMMVTSLLTTCQARSKVHALLVDVGEPHCGPGSGLKGPYPTTNKVQSKLKEFSKRYQEFNLDDSNLWRLSDNPRNPWHQSHPPTKQNVMHYLNAMITNAQPGDTCIFVYSGHGGRWWDPSHPYAQNKQFQRQYLCLTGKSFGEFLWDSELHEILFRAKTGVKILVLLDACHSGYTTSLPFRLGAAWNASPQQPGFDMEAEDISSFMARYNNWNKTAGWRHSEQYFPNPHQQNQPFIIAIGSSEYSEVSFCPGKADAFMIRMLPYMFGDANRTHNHYHRNWGKTLGQQYFMTLDSDKLRGLNDPKRNQFGQHPVLTTNTMFVYDDFNLWDFMTRDFELKNGVYRLRSTNTSSIQPEFKPTQINHNCLLNAEQQRQWEAAMNQRHQQALQAQRAAQAQWRTKLDATQDQSQMPAVRCAQPEHHEAELPIYRKRWFIITAVVVGFLLVASVAVCIYYRRRGTAERRPNVIEEDL